MKCISCGYELPEGAKFCGKCGTKQEKPQEFCMNCGTKIENGMAFCMECGTPVGEVAEEVSNVLNPIQEVSEKETNDVTKNNNSLKVNKYNICWREKSYSSSRSIAKSIAAENFVEYKNKLYFMVQRWDVINATTRDSRGTFVLGIMDNSRDEITYYELGTDEYDLPNRISFTIFNDKVYYTATLENDDHYCLKSFDLRNKKIENVQKLKDLNNWVSNPMFDVEGNFYYVADNEDGSKSFLMDATGKKISECASIVAFNDRFIYFEKDFSGQSLLRYEMLSHEKVDIIKKYKIDSKSVLFVDPSDDTLYVKDPEKYFEMGKNEFKGISLINGSESIIEAPKVALYDSQLSQHKMCFNGKNYIFRKNPVRGEGNFGIILFDKKGNIISDCLEMYTDYHNESDVFIFTQNYVVSIFRDPNSGGKEGYCLANVNTKSKAITPILQYLS